MAVAAAGRKTRYQSYGNVAYDPAYAQPARRPAERGGAEVLRPQPKVRPRQRAAARPKVQVREQGRISIFAVVGFLAVGVFAALVMMSYVQLTVVSDQVVSLRSELDSLKTEESKLMARYDLAFDLSAIEAQVTADGSMTKPQSGQIVMLDMSEPDTVVRYRAEGETEKSGLLDKTKEILSGFQAYFQ